ncbi:MAG: hypothetical protein RL483_115 [Pseudomonadota bacterium]|jgi:cell division protein ZapD
MSGLFGHPPQIFDFPCNERVRMMLRLECLGNRLHQLITLDTPAAHEAWLSCHFELYDLLSTRSDVKNELLQELERQRQALSRYEGKPGVAADRLERVLTELSQTYTQLSDVPMRLGPHLPEHEFLNTLKGRAGIPAGSCSFDLPALHVWLKRPLQDRIDLMASWLRHLEPIIHAAGLGLGFMRDGSEPHAHVAVNGAFEMSPNGRQAKLIRIQIHDERELVCEVSANKYVVAVRFRQLNAQLGLSPIEGELPFQMALCDL